MSASDGVPHRRRPCAECPWRRDVPAGKFTSERYDALAATSGGPGCEAPVSAPMFACHKTAEGAEQACAGWLAVAGGDHLGVRVAVIQGRLDPAVLEPGEAWPPLFGSFDEMADTQSR
ncbi:hypothetical protein Br6_04813 [Rhodococcus sp. Br-6]|nr:hypothetical protein Br6_04813 [Rhodococcus sp. Br-6]